MADIDEIVSQTPQTMEDEISGNFCVCGHLISEHFLGTITGTSTCYGLEFNGTIWAGCNCDKILLWEFNIHATIPENSATKGGEISG
jgi:hypothetical protein